MVVVVVAMVVLFLPFFLPLGESAAAASGDRVENRIGGSSIGL